MKTVCEGLYGVYQSGNYGIRIVILVSNRLDLPFDQFIDSISIKTEDKDIVEKVNLLLDYNKQSDLNELFLKVKLLNKLKKQRFKIK